jgi:hypothetical protein
LLANYHKVFALLVKYLSVGSKGGRNSIAMTESNVAPLILMLGTHSACGGSFE